MTDIQLKLRLIETPNQPEPDYLLIYNRIILKKLTEAMILGYVDPEVRKQLIYYSVKAIPLRYASGRITDRKALDEIYPIEKSYDGNKYGTVDYFFTMEQLEEFGMDELITKDRVMDVLFNYDNTHIRKYGCTKLCVISDLRRCEGHPGLAEEFFGPLGVGMYKKMTDENGRQFFYDPEKQTTYPVTKPRPRYLRVI